MRTQTGLTGLTGGALLLFALPAMAATPTPAPTPTTTQATPAAEAEPYPQTLALAAQPPPSAVGAPAELEPLTVVGSRVARPQSQTAASIDLVSARELEYRQASTLGEALGALPGVSVEGGPRANAQFLNVRGLSGPRVLLLVDGARQNFLGGHRSSLLVDPELLQQVELLRGPASAIWGSDALGGVVALRTKDAADFLQPGERLAGRVRLGYESVSGEHLSSGIGALRLGPVDGLLSLVRRSAQDYERADGSAQPNSGLGVNGQLAKLSWLPEASGHSLGLVHHGFVQSSVSPSNPATTVSDTNPLIDRENDTLYSVARYGFEGAEGGWLRAADLSVYRDDLRIREDRVDEPRHDITRFRTHGASGHVSLPLPGPASPFRRNQPLLTLGGDFYADRARATRDGEPRPQYPDAERRVEGVFAQVEWSWGPVTLLPGLRYDRYQARSLQDDSAAVREEALSPKLGLVWDVFGNARLQARASVNSAFRAPGLIEIYAAGQHFLGNNFVPNPQLRPEQARNVEVGLEARWPGLRFADALRARGSLYRNEVDDYIELFVTVEEEVPAPRCLAPTPPVGCVNRSDDGSLNPLVPPIYVGGSTSSRNLPQATIHGGELELGWELGIWQLGTSYSHTRGSDDNSGAPLLSIPADRLRTTLDLRPWAGLRATLGHSHHFAQDRVPTVTDENGDTQNLIPTTPGYGVWDLALSWEPRGRKGRLWGLRAPRLVAGIDNLSNTAYRNHLNVLESPGRNLRLSLSAGF